MSQAPSVPRAIGNTEHDALIGALIERTDQLQKQSEQNEQTLKVVNETLNRFDRSMLKFEHLLDSMTKEQTRLMKNKEDSDDAVEKDIDDICRRLNAMQEYKADWEFIRSVRNKLNNVITWAIVVGIIAMVVLLATTKKL